VVAGDDKSLYSFVFEPEQLVDDERDIVLGRGVVVKDITGEENKHSLLLDRVIYKPAEAITDRSTFTLGYIARELAEACAQVNIADMEERDGLGQRNNSN
jgi:hypothetical protein